MGWFQDAIERATGRDAARTPADESAPEALSDMVVPAPPTASDILAAARSVATDQVPPVVAWRVRRVVRVIEEMVPRLDRLGGASQQAHTVVAAATSYLPEAVNGYLRLPRDFADRRVVHDGKTSLMIVCDQLDLLALALGRISDAVSHQDADALIAHGQFLADKFADSSLTLPASPSFTLPDAGAPASPRTERCAGADSWGGSAVAPDPLAAP